MFPSGRLIFLAFLYFLQGLPYGLQSKFLPVYFYTHGMTLSNVGLFKLLLTPWMCKALWAPLVDRYGTKKVWLTSSMIGLSFTCLIGSISSPDRVFQLAMILFLFNLLTATQDIAVDGLAIQILATSELASGNIAQVVGYKIGAIASGGFLTWLNDYVNWGGLFIGLMLVYFCAFVCVHVVVPASKGELDETGSDENEIQMKLKSVYPGLVEHFRKIFADLDTRWLIVFVLLYKLGENGALGMLPLFLVYQHIPSSSVGFWTGVIGQITSIGGSVLGGWLVSAYGYTPYKIVKIFCQLRIVFVVILTLTVMAWQPGDINTLLYVTSVIAMNLMLLGSGIITTATFTLMMFSSQRVSPSIQASHYTTLATLEVLGKLSFSVVIGPLTDLTGYPAVFCVFVILSVILVPVLNQCPTVLIDMSENGPNKNH